MVEGFRDSSEFRVLIHKSHRSPFHFDELISPTLQNNFRIQQITFPCREHLHRARLELGNLRLRVERVVGEQIRGRFSKTTSLADFTCTLKLYIYFTYIPLKILPINLIAVLRGNRWRMMKLEIRFMRPGITKGPFPKAFNASRTT
jgi:hypothetical protein